MKLTYPPGATPLDPNDAQDLIPGITTQAELNEVEAATIANAQRWVDANLGALRTDILTDTGLRRLHERMFNEVWLWAGRYRKRQTNIGVEPNQIAERVRHLCDDVRYWVQNGIYEWPEIATRFHHKLVSIHPFPNGNGRHARLAADALLSANDQPLLTWGGRHPIEAGALRTEYLTSLREADNHHYERLLRFAQS